MFRQLAIRNDSYRLVAPFRIARGVKSVAEVVTVEIRQGAKIGRGESVPYGRYGESVKLVVDQMEALRHDVAAGMGRDALQTRLGPGAARNALDTAIWDLESQLESVPVWTQLAQQQRAPLASAITVGIDTPERMGEAASLITNAGLIKLKVDADNPVARIQAVRRAAPTARLIVDPNESWTIGMLRDLLPVLEHLGVDLLEQPLPAGADEVLRDVSSSIPICADEACHVTSDLPRLHGCYQAVNIKLDKTGGLTEAWRLLHTARAQGLKIMVGCMVCSSLGIAPALEIARDAEFVDLDGPVWLQNDYPDGVRFKDGLLMPPSAGFWGG